MEFSAYELELLRDVSRSKKLVYVEGANFMGDMFETCGFLMLSSGAGESYAFMNKEQLLLFQGQIGEPVSKNDPRKFNFLTLTPDFSKRHSLCVNKISLPDGKEIYKNQEFDKLYQDICWEVRRLYGLKEPALETNVVILKGLIGKPVVVNGERTNLHAVCEDRVKSSNAVICVGNGYKEEVIVCRPQDVKQDEEAASVINKMAENYEDEGSQS